jgi:hypothetical protein
MKLSDTANLCFIGRTTSKMGENSVNNNNNVDIFLIHFDVAYLSRRMRWAGHVARRGEKRNVYRLLVARGKETTRKTETQVD